MNIYDGKPSIILDHRPFFSITIPCYNSKNKLPRLLESILKQDMNDDIEIIICDDHSTESYQEVIDKYKDKLCIKQVQTKYNFGPGNTREEATHYATGILLTNCDHDDELTPNALKIVREKIETTKEEYLVRSTYRESYLDNTGKIIKNIDRKADNFLTHGKFFNMDNLWKKYDIHYRKNLKTHEDIYVSRLVNAIMESIGHKPLVIDECTYIFYQHSDSINSTRYRKCTYNGEPHKFIEVYYNDWCTANYDMCPSLYNNHIINNTLFLEYMLGLIIYDYEFINAFMNKDNYIKRNVDIAYAHLEYVKEVFHLDNEKILNLINKYGRKLQKTAPSYIKLYVGYKYTYIYSMKEWMDFLSTYKPVILKERGRD